MKECFNCGREIEDSMIICPYCGQEQPQKKDPKFVAIVLTVGGIAILALVLFLVFSLKNLFSRQINNTVANGVKSQNTTVATNDTTTDNSVSVRDRYSQDASQFYNTVSQYTVYQQGAETVSKANLDSQEAQTQNSQFESYFGKEITPSQVKNLLSQIRTNNLTASRNEEAATVGVCYISKNVDSDIKNGIYNADIDSSTLKSTVFDNLYFSPDAQKISSVLKSGTSYTVSVPNSEYWKDDASGETGFELNGDDLGQAVTGNSGGYYSSGYIRLIYIVENEKD